MSIYRAQRSAAPVRPAGKGSLTPSDGAVSSLPARVTKGANTAAWLRPVMMAATDDRIAAAFSSSMRQYSAGEQAPRAINRLRLITVSHDAAVRRAIVIGNASGEFRMFFPIPLKMRIRILAASAPLRRNLGFTLMSGRLAVRKAS
jgi:hypothetical protein